MSMLRGHVDRYDNLKVVEKMNLPLANILHNKMRSIFCVMGIGLGVCMLITLAGLSRGSLYEVADRMNCVDADVIIVPPGLAGKTPTLSGIAISEKVADILRKKYPGIVDRCVPVCIGSLKLGGQDQRVMGISPQDWDVITNRSELKEGRVFDPDNRFYAWITDELLKPSENDDSAELLDLSDKLATHGGLEIVIDSRLAAAGKYKLGQTVRAGNHDWKIVGIVPAGVPTRVFMPIRTAQYLFGFGDIKKCTMIFVKFKPGVDVLSSAKRIATDMGIDALPMSQYRDVLQNNFGVMFSYVDAVNIVALVIAFLIVTVTQYMMVIQQTREIAIMKSCGAGGAFILRQVMNEAMLLTVAGIVAGVAMSFAAAAAIMHFKPLLTVLITSGWILTATLAAIIGAVVSALYPAWRASKVDMLEALAYE